MKKNRILPKGWKEVVVGKEFKTGSGGTPLTTRKEFYAGGTIPWINSGELNENYIDKARYYITELGLKSSSAKVFPKGTVLIAMYGATAGKTSLLNIDACTNQAICAILENPDYSNLFLKYNLENLYDYLVKSSSGSARDNLSQEGLSELSLFFPKEKKDQEDLIKILHLIDNKISLNTRINAELEAMAKQFYDYWFVQFDFPDENGKPYKSSGGKMVYNSTLKREIPEGWEVKTLSEVIGEDKSGDWGQDEEKGNFSLKVNCIRGADLKDPYSAPLRFINAKNTNRLLQKNNIIIEISGGSPVQATGRSLFVTKGLLNNFHDSLICSNFCHALVLQDSLLSPYFYFLWNMFYENGNMFNFEGKTSGIKNLLLDTFLGNYWYFPPKHLYEHFANDIQNINNLLDSNKKQNQNLTRLRDSLLPMLMNGQVTVE